MVAAEYGDKVFGNNCTFQQDGAKPHTHHLSQQWCQDNLSDFSDKDCWPPNSPDLNTLDYAIWDELAHAIKWDRVTAKKTLIDELKKAAPRIRNEVVQRSCAAWTSRLSDISKNGGECISK